MEHGRTIASDNMLSTMLAFAKKQHEGSLYSTGNPFFSYYLLGVMGELTTTQKFQTAEAELQVKMLTTAVGSSLIDLTETTDEQLYLLGVPFDVVHSILVLSKRNPIKKTLNEHINIIKTDEMARAVKIAATTFEIKHIKNVQDKTPLAERYTILGQLF